MLINLRNALMTGKRLPYDAEVEYLESTGTQWINTGVAWNRAMTVSATVAGLQSTTFPLQSLFGARDINAANAGYSFGFNSSNKFVSDNSGSRATSSMSYAQGDVYTVVKNLSGCSITNAAGTTENLVNNAGTQTATYNLFLFALNNIGSAVITKSRFYGCKIRDANNTLVRDYIPVRKGTVGYLYDRVSGKLFGNAGTGDFVLGPDVVPVEWLEGGQLDSGIAFIDTGYTPNSSTKIESTAAVLSASGYSGRFGNRSRLTFGCFTDGNLYLAQGDHYYLGDCTTGTFYSFVNDIPNRTVSIKGVGSTSTTAVSDWYPQLYPVYLFASNLAPLNNGTVVNNKMLDSNSFGQIRMKSCSIWENDIPVRKFRPVRVGTEGAMMDVLTRRIYRNQGTGAFGYGNDLKYPIPSE